MRRSRAISLELNRLLLKRRAVRRLQGERPRTTDIGSWGVIQAAKDLVMSRDCAEKLRVTVLLGSQLHGPRAPQIRISDRDSLAAIDHQWETLKAAFHSPHSALLFHLKNHYALVFAWREWLQREGEDSQVPGSAAPQLGTCMRRQILTARRGQKPSTWLDFQEVREIILGSTGYHLLLIEKSQPGEAGAAAGRCPLMSEEESDGEEDVDMDL